MKSWKTTVFGALAACFTALAAVPDLKDFSGFFIAGAAICTALVGYFAKDGNVTGGTKQQ